MGEAHYLFIDGNYFQMVLRDMEDRLYPGETMTPNWQIVGHGFSKVFYYDCLPAQKANQSAEEYAALRKPQADLFEQLRNIDGWHVNEGIAHHRKKSGQTQKEVDILIAVDMLGHAHRKNASFMTFFAGDQDFCPLLEAVVREGVFVTLMYDPKGGYSRDLRNTADAARKLDFPRLYGWMTDAFKNAHAVPTYVFGQNVWGPVKEIGFRDGIACATLYPQDYEWIIVEAGAQTAENHGAGRYRGFDAEFLKRYYEELRGACEWKTPGA